MNSPLFDPIPAHAQPASETRDTILFDIPSQSLASALTLFGRQSGRQIAMDTEAVAGIRSSRIYGPMSVRSALNEMLEGTQIAAREDDNGTIIVAQQDTSRSSPVQKKNEEIEEMVVTGTKQNLTLQDTQASVEFFNAERIEREVLFSLDDVLLRTANVSAVNVQSNFSIRGIGQGGVGFTGTGLTSNIYVDGVPLSSNAQQGVQSLWDVGQVEVLRGPQSTVQGRNALAGAIIIKTLDPTHDWEVRARGQFATEETVKASAAISGPIVTDQLAFRLAYDYQSYDGDVVEATTGIPQEFQDSHLARGKLLLEPKKLPGLRVELTGEYVNTEFGEFNTIFAPVPFADPSFSSFDPFGGETFTRVRIENPMTIKAIADISYNVGDHWTLIGIGTYEDHNREREFGAPANGSVLFSPSPIDNETLTGEVRAAFDYGRFSGWIGGYYFNEDEFSENSFILEAAAFPFPTAPAGSLIIIEAPQTIGTENYAVFGDLTFDLNEKWSFNFGARYDWEEFSDTGSQGSVTSDPANCTATTPFGVIPCSLLFPANNTPGQPAEFEAFLPRGSITYNVGDDRSVSFAVQRGYRAGGATLRVVPSQGINELVTFDPEFVTNFELAFRSQWLEKRLTVNANAFYMDWKDQQVTLPGPTGDARDSIVTNAGSSRTMGLELSLAYQPTDQWDFFATLGLLDTEFTNFPFANSPPAPANAFENLDGNSFPTAPAVSGAAGISYEHPSGAYTSWNVSFRTSQESEVANLDVNQVGGYTLVNGRVGYRFPNVNIYAFANNLFDERFVTRRDFATVNTGTGEIRINSNARFQVNEPRIAGIGIDFSL